MTSLRVSLAGVIVIRRETLVCTSCALEHEASRLSNGRVVFDAHFDSFGPIGGRAPGLETGYSAT